MKAVKSGVTMAIAAALTLGAASLASAQQSNPSGTLMEERQGAVGAVQGRREAGPIRAASFPAADAPSADDEAKATTGQTSQGGPLDFGSKGNDANSLPAQRQGTIGTGERPPEPTTQGGVSKQ